MSEHIALNSITKREAIVDALYRCVIGLDANDKSLFESAWVAGEESSFEMGDNVMKGTNVLNERLFSVIGPLDTQHVLSNIRVDAKEGASDAYVTAYAVAQHYKAGEGVDPASNHLMSGARYFVDVVEDKADGLWKIRRWVMKLIWLDGDRSVVVHK